MLRIYLNQIGKQALNLAKDRAGIPHSQQPSRQWQVGDDITKKGANYSNYEYSANPTHHGTYYEYDTPQGKKIIVDHTNDVQQGLHTHAGQVPPSVNELFEIMTYDFKDAFSHPYYPIGGTHHIHYK